MPSFLETYNPSILAIPIYYVLSVLPHTYSLHVATQGNLGTWDNRNPRSTDLRAKLKKQLPAETFARYERLEACHANGLEVSLDPHVVIRPVLIWLELAALRYSGCAG
jgi:hypothetical protein